MREAFLFHNFREEEVLIFHYTRQNFHSCHIKCGERLDMHRLCIVFKQYFSARINLAFGEYVVTLEECYVLFIGVAKEGVGR